jgi:hypothetical protein
MTHLIVSRFSQKNLPLLNLTLCKYFSTTLISFAARSGRLRRKKDPEAELYDIEKMPEYGFDAMTKPGFDILLAQREVRNYLRKTKFELPQLSS